MNLKDLRYDLSTRLRNARQRCTNPNTRSYKDYGARGIKCFLTIDEMVELWFLDEAWLMKRPSIDRINNDGNYTFLNCRFIELSQNTIRAHKGAKRTESTKRKIGSAREIPKGEWSLWHKKCLGCGTTRRRHRARGRCENCYQRYMYQLKKGLRNEKTS